MGDGRRFEYQYITIAITSNGVKMHGCWVQSTLHLKRECAVFGILETDLSAGKLYWYSAYMRRCHSHQLS